MNENEREPEFSANGNWAEVKETYDSVADFEAGRRALLEEGWLVIYLQVHYKEEDLGKLRPLLIKKLPPYKLTATYKRRQ